jgi:hypothetical protein
MRHQPPLQQPEQLQSLHIRVENTNIEWWSYGGAMLTQYVWG